MQKTISLNGHIRTEIINGVMRRWREQQPAFDPKPSIDFTPGDLKARETRRKQENEYRRNLSLALGTFKTLNALVKEWPEIEGYVPEILTNPRKAIELPAIPEKV